ncbi:hypothetical protein [Sphingomonas sp.]|uniref:hypothetical protein n=1 Tax=Sphingomonas sp. TaxID=28214 RepID=UPI0025DFEA09|nr:hypothetical protein [Sphingomonas sp.]
MAAIVTVDPAAAQFGSFLRSIAPSGSSSSSSSTKCERNGKSAGKGASMMGKMFGNATNRALGGTGIAQFVPIPEVAGILSDAIACQLDQKEQQQAATATQTVVRGGEIGSTSEWKSDSREGVSGKSTLTARAEQADGTSCVQVTDVIIVNGEETTVPKKMCRAPGASGYSIAQA